jgi:hypothetical protein
MGAQTATRAQVLVALRRWKPNMSLRRLGDLIDSGKLMSVKGDHEIPASLAFGVVIEGAMRIKVEDAPWRWVGPGETFGTSEYELTPRDMPVTIVGVSNTTRYLAFAHDSVEGLNFSARAPERPAGVS